MFVSHLLSHTCCNIIFFGMKIGCALHTQSCCLSRGMLRAALGSECSLAMLTWPELLWGWYGRLNLHRHTYIVWRTAFLWPGVSSCVDTSSDHRVKCRAMNAEKIEQGCDQPAFVSDSRFTSCFAIMRCPRTAGTGLILLVCIRD